MRLMIPVDIDLGESSLSEHEVKDNVAEFAREILPIIDIPLSCVLGCGNSL